MRRFGLIAVLALGCKDTPPSAEDLDADAVLGVEESGSFTVPGLKGEVHVLSNEYGVPWIYAKDREDLGRAVGFVLARDRYFYMDLARRLAQGETAQLLGADALSTDIEARMTGMTFITDRLLVMIQADPELGPYFEAVAAGVNAAAAEMRAGTLPTPSEYDLAGPLLGTTAAGLVTDFDLRDVVAGVVTILYESGFETKDIGRSSDAAALASVFDGAPEQALREAGIADIWDRAEPVYAVASAPDWPTANRPIARRARSLPPIHGPVLDRLKVRLDRIEQRLGHDWVGGFGSNAWVVSGSRTADGRTLVAADGHLSLSTPTLFYSLGLDTRTFGGDLRQVGMVTPALPLLAVGTNGDVAFGQTQLMGDITDWYAEQLVPGADGLPAAAIFNGAEVPLVRFDETFQIAAIALLGSEGGSQTITRFTTADGRWITSVEGREVSGPDDVAEGETAINLLGDWVVPEDQDGDGLLSAISFDYAGLDLSNMPGAIDRYTRATDVAQFAEATRDLVAYSLNLVAGDKNGGVLYSAYQAVPCRRYLDRGPDGAWIDGADPNLLLDGTRYGGFTIPIVDGRVDTSQGDDPYRCVIGWDEYPHSLNPEQGFVVSANNDPGGTTFDGSLTDDDPYIGGPWIEGYRAWRIHRDLDALPAATLQDMMDVQADHRSTIGEQLVPELMRAVALVDAAITGGTDDPSLQRAVDAWSSDPAAAEAVSRVSAWMASGGWARSGVETFYDAPTDQDRADAVATTIFNAWMGRYVGRTVNDEGLPGLGWPTGDTGRFRLLTKMIEGRGADNPLELASWNPATEESVYFDDKLTPELETSAEVAILALVDALAFLRGPETEPGQGGFGTDDMDAWVWGMRHHVRFKSLLGDFFDADDPLLGRIIAPLDISPEDLPLAEGLTAADPRFGLPGFPRPGDHLGIDAANSGTGGSQFSFGSGSVYRWAVALGGSGFEAYNVLPGGQSGLTSSPHFADQAALWVGNDAMPLPIEPTKVAAVAVKREVLRP